jgi:hypothetical protein
MISQYEKLTEEQTINKLTITPDCKNSYEPYLISDYTIYTAFENDCVEFINYISQQKIIFPQLALLVSIVKMDISLCDLCLSFGCKIDENCITLACATFNVEMIEYCIKKMQFQQKMI